MKFLGNLSLGTRIMLLTAIGLLAGAGLLSYPGVRATNEATNIMLEDRLTTARLVADYLDESLRLSVEILQDTARQINIEETPSETDFHVSSLLSTYERLSIATDSIYLMDGHGQIVWSEPDAREMSAVNLDDVITTALEMDQTNSSISNLVVSPVSSEPVILIASPNTANADKAYGFLITAIDLSRSGIMGYVNPLRLGNTGYTEIVDQNGIVVLRTEPGPKIEPFEKSDHSGHFSALIATGKPTRGLCHTCHESALEVTKRDVLAFVPLASASWGVVIRQAEAEALAPIRKLQQELLLSVGGLIVLAFGITVFTTRDIVNRVKSLTVVSSRIAEGDFSSPVATTRKDEVGTLAQTLDTMRSRLKASHEETAQRTKELSSLLSVSEALSSLPGLTDLATALGNALDRTLEITGADASGLLLLNEEKHVFSYLVSRGFPSEFIESAVYPTGEDNVMPPLLTTKPTVFPNLATSPVNAISDHLKTGGFNAMVSIPLYSPQGPPGFLLLANRGVRDFTQDEVRLVEGITRHITTALENIRLHQEVQRKEAIRGELLQDIISVQEEERRRIARELHDETSQVLASLNANLQAAISTLSTDTGKTETLLKKVQSMTVNILDNINNLIYQLRPSLLDDLGLVPAIRWLGNNNLKPGGVSLRLSARGRRRRLSREIETALFRVVQETFNNIIRHARARSVTVTLLFEDSLCTLDIADDGIGFDVEEAIHSTARPRGLGLIGMTERIELIGGKITIRSQHSKGTQIHIEIPHRKEANNGQNKNTHSR